MNKKVLIGSIALAVVSLAGVGIFAANAANNGFGSPWASQEKADAVQKAIENKDYSAWKGAMSDMMSERMNSKFSRITPDNFGKFSEMHKLMQEGKFEEAQKIREELGMPIGGGRMMGGRGGFGMGGGGCPMLNVQ